MKKTIPLLFLLLLLAGAFLRLRNLDYPTMGSDVMVYYGICQSGVSPGELLLHSPKYLGDLPPLWFAAHNWFLQTFSLEVNFRNARLPDAIAGILTILVAFGAGRAAGGKRVGLLTALFVALQPLHIQMSRECYFYAPIVLGGFLAAWAFMHLARRTEEGLPPGGAFYALAFSSFVLLVNVQISSWSFAAIFALALYAMLLPAVFRRRCPWPPVLWLTLGFAAIGIPSLLSDWGMRDAITSLFGDRKDYWNNIFGDRLGNPWLDSGHILLAYLTGAGGLRIWSSLICVLAAAGALGAQWKSNLNLRRFGLFAAGTIALLVTLHMKSAYPMENRHYANLFPLLAILASIGLIHWGDFIFGKTKWRPSAKGLSLALASLFVIGVNAYPAWLCTHLDWDPPYAKVAEWTNTQLPAKTVVLCDRWFTPWNEFRTNPSTNVTFTFTVPSEPIQAYTDNRWRDTVKEFLAINPLAAYFESKTHWPRLGPWTWPHAQFARRQAFEDEIAARLNDMGLFYRARQLAYPRDWIPVTLFYNTEEDVVARARNAGDRLLCLFGAGWEYTKTQDYRDWYALKEAATLTLHNLTDAPIAATLNVSGAATPGAVTITAYSGANATFAPNQVQTQRLGPIQLAPGRNEIRLGNLTRTQPPAALLVQKVSAAEN